MSRFLRNLARRAVGTPVESPVLPRLSLYDQPPLASEWAVPTESVIDSRPAKVVASPTLTSAAIAAPPIQRRAVPSPVAAPTAVAPSPNPIAPVSETTLPWSEPAIVEAESTTVAVLPRIAPSEPLRPIEPASRPLAKTETVHPVEVSTRVIEPTSEPPNRDANAVPVVEEVPSDRRPQPSVESRIVQEILEWNLRAEANDSDAEAASPVESVSTIETPTRRPEPPRRPSPPSVPSRAERKVSVKIGSLELKLKPETAPPPVLPTMPAETGFDEFDDVRRYRF